MSEVSAATAAPPIDDVGDAIGRVPLGGARDVRVAYTPLHGVGAATLIRAFMDFGFAAPMVAATAALIQPGDEGRAYDRGTVERQRWPL